MALYEYRIEAFNARGNDEYLDRFAQRLEVLFDRGWNVIERKKDTASPGRWRVELFKEDDQGQRRGVQTL